MSKISPFQQRLYTLGSQIRDAIGHRLSKGINVALKVAFYKQGEKVYEEEIPASKPKMATLRMYEIISEQAQADIMKAALSDLDTGSELHGFSDTYLSNEEEDEDEPVEVPKNMPRVQRVQQPILSLGNAPTLGQIYELNSQLQVQGLSHNYERQLDRMEYDLKEQKKKYEELEARHKKAINAYRNEQKKVSELEKNIEKYELTDRYIDNAKTIGSIAAPILAGLVSNPQAKEMLGSIGQNLNASPNISEQVEKDNLSEKQHELIDLIKMAGVQDVEAIHVILNACMTYEGLTAQLVEHCQKIDQANK